MVYIGTSGWHYKHWVGPFYPPKTPAKAYLDIYRERFSTVEINNSFYHLPKPETLRDWAARTPGDFVFAVKASRYITHVKKLKNPDRGIKKFLGVVRSLGPKLGPILFQLPPGWRCNTERLAAFLDALPSGHRYTFEFRNPDWHNAEVYDLLKRHNAAFCIFDLKRILSPKEVTADFVYIRLHGPGDAYQGSYGQSALAGWAGAFKAWQRQGKDTYCYFDNDQDGYAGLNAVQLKKMFE